jgi:hypothetical protein
MCHLPLLVNIPVPLWGMKNANSIKLLFVVSYFSEKEKL